MRGDDGICTCSDVFWRSCWCWCWCRSSLRSARVRLLRLLRLSRPGASSVSVSVRSSSSSWTPIRLVALRVTRPGVDGRCKGPASACACATDAGPERSAFASEMAQPAAFRIASMTEFPSRLFELVLGWSDRSVAGCGGLSSLTTWRELLRLGVGIER